MNQLNKLIYRQIQKIGNYLIKKIKKFEIYLVIKEYYNGINIR